MKRNVTYGPANGVTRGEQHRRRQALIASRRVVQPERKNPMTWQHEVKYILLMLFYVFMCSLGALLMFGE
jgi:hypothetical protein